MAEIYLKGETIADLSLPCSRDVQGIKGFYFTNLNDNNHHDYNIYFS